jgi:hypothetical protein
MSDEPKTVSEIASMGGKKAAANMTPAERSERAKQAAETRWAAKLPSATHAGVLKLGDKTEIQCAVLEDGRRVLNQETFLLAIGRSAKATAGTGSTQLGQVDKLPPFLGAANLKPFIDDELRRSTNPVIYRTQSGGKGYGYLATLLPEVCKVYLDAERAGEIRKNQLHVVQACRVLQESLANVAIIALVDEATGYQYDRPRMELQEFLALYINKKLARWVPTFPPDFYREIYRLHPDWKYDANSNQRTPLVGKITNDVIYERLAPFVLEELKRITPKNEKGRRKHKFHQRLTPEPGIKALADHFKEVLAIMRGYDDWPSFYRHLNRSLPPQPQNVNQTTFFSCFPELMAVAAESLPAPASSNEPKQLSGQSPPVAPK